MKVPQLKSILFELINEAKFGHRFKISIGKKIYSALISTNLANDEEKYRITWFDPETMEPNGHVDFGEETLKYIVHYKKFPIGISLKYFKLGLPSPKIIVEVMKQRSLHPTAADILVGTIDPDDGYVEAKFGGSHQALKCKNNKKGDFRFNDETETVYWHQDHPRKYEALVDEYILNNLGQEVKKHITLDRVRGNITAYTHFWNDAHGIEQQPNNRY